MLFKVFAVAGWVAVSAISAAQAQSLPGPAETPPASYKGTQYVDSRGCVFLRAGIGGRVSWVPRITRDRKALCGSSRATAVKEVAEPAPAPRTVAAAPRVAPAPVARPAASTGGYVGKPMETIASLPRSTPRAVAPVAKAAPQVVAAAPKPAAPKSANAVRRQSGCPSSAPYGARVTMADGRRSLLCSAEADFDVQAALRRVQVARAAPAGSGYTPKVAANDGYTPKPRATAAVAATAPVAAAGNGYRCPASAPVAKRYQIQGGGSTVMCTTAAGGIADATPPLAIPKGYRKAWKDDRLNPNRGKGTARGQAQQDQIWTREIPARLVADAAPKKVVKRKVYATSASNAPRKAQATAGRFYVQVGTFGEPANANRTASRLKGLGLPVAKSGITSKGRKLQIVMAGPFGDAGSAQAALSKARRSGFGDAFIR